MNWQLLLQYLDVLLSAQVVFGLLAVIFIKIFREQIRGLIERIARIKFPGGELTTQSSKLADEEPQDSPKLPEVDDSADVSVPPSLNLTPEQTDELRVLLHAERAKAYFWEYQYLNYFLVRHTQEVLDWLGQLESTTVNVLDQHRGTPPTCPSVDVR